MEKGYDPQPPLQSGMPDSSKISIDSATPNSTLDLRMGRVISGATGNQNHLPANLAFDQNDEASKPASPFLKLPGELRIRIYRYLLHAHGNICIGIRFADPLKVSKTMSTRYFPDTDRVRCSAFYGRMSTYGIKAIGIYPAILSVNRQTYLEASKIIYSENHFDFGSSIEAGRISNATVIPFLEDLSEGSRHLIKQIEYSYILTDCSWYHYDPTDFVPIDQVFKETCDYLSQNLRLECVRVSCFALDLAPIGGYPSNFDKQSWVQHLIPLVKNLDSFRINLSPEDAGPLNDFLCTAQTYLESKMDKASKRVRQTRTMEESVYELAASEE